MAQSGAPRRPLDIKPLLLALIDFGDVLTFGGGGGAATGDVQPWLYWPRLFKDLEAFKFATSDAQLPTSLSVESREAVDALRYAASEIEGELTTAKSYGRDPVSREAVYWFIEFKRRFYATLPKGMFLRRASRDLNTSRASRSAKPLIHAEGDTPPAWAKYGPVFTSQEALGYALHPNRDRLSQNSPKSFHDMVAQKTNQINPIVWCQTATSRKLAVYFRDETRRLEAEILISKYKGRSTRPKRKTPGFG